ncbi:MAG: RtcB family protein, partial [Candidatus Nanoarchaeia archaeon]|nr:RtcB family protein [Candidatus Nanoarchaeia archaeon]
MFEIKGKYTTAKVMIDDVEPTCIAQIYGFVNHPAFTNPIAIMPDTHSGKGSVIGFTMAMTDKVIPNVVGVDVGCGVLSINIDKVLPIAFEQLDHKIRQRVPFGFDTHEHSIIDMKKEFPWHSVNTLSHNFSLAYNQ